MSDVEDFQQVFEDAVDVFCSEEDRSLIQIWLHVCLGSRLLHASALLCTLPVEEQLEMLASRHPKANPRIREFIETIRNAADTPSQLRALRSEILNVQHRIEAMIQLIGYANLREKGAKLMVLISSKLDGIMEAAEELSSLESPKKSSSVENLDIGGQELRDGFPELLRITKMLAKNDSEDLESWFFCILLSERARLYATVCEIPNTEVRDRLASHSDVAREIIDGLFLKGDIQNTMRMAQIRDLERRRPLVGRALRRLEMAQSDFVETLAADEARPDRSSE